MKACEKNCQEQCKVLNFNEQIELIKQKQKQKQKKKEYYRPAMKISLIL